MRNLDTSRQDLLVPDLTKLDATLIGAGAVGRNVGMMLASIGVRKVSVYDHDTVEPVNLASQGWMDSDLSRSKAERITSWMRCLGMMGPHTGIPDRWRPRYGMSPYVFCCVDSIDTRSAIFNYAKEGNAQLFIDTRMLGEVMRVLSVRIDNPEEVEYYLSTIFDEDEAEEGRCTRQSTLYTANITASLAVHQFVTYLRIATRESTEPFHKDIYLDLGSHEFTFNVEEQQGFSDARETSEESEDIQEAEEVALTEE